MFPPRDSGVQGRILSNYKIARDAELEEEMGSQTPGEGEGRERGGEEPGC